METPTDDIGADLAILRRALDWHGAGHAVAIASVVSTWGSAPCPAGSQLVIREDMRFEGSVSGGCVETAVIQEAVDMMATSHAGPKLLTYGVSDAQAFDVGLACGGTVEVLLQRLHADSARNLAPSVLAEALECVQERRAAVLTCALSDGRCALHHPAPAPAAPLAEDAPLDQRIALAARDDRSGRHGDYFLKVFNPRLRLVIVGAVHVAQHLAAMAQRCNYEVVVVDPREAFLRGRFEHVQTHTHWPDQALRALGLDPRTAVVTLTHDPKLDDPALVAALDSESFYIGALGSRRTQAKRRERLAEGGYGAAAVARIHGPVGLDLGARGPGEIAVSILAQITATLRGRSSAPPPLTE